VHKMFVADDPFLDVVYWYPVSVVFAIVQQLKRNEQIGDWKFLLPVLKIGCRTGSFKRKWSVFRAAYNQQHCKLKTVECAPFILYDGALLLILLSKRSTTWSTLLPFEFLHDAWWQEIIIAEIKPKPHLYNCHLSLINCWQTYRNIN